MTTDRLVRPRASAAVAAVARGPQSRRHPLAALQPGEQPALPQSAYVYRLRAQTAHLQDAAGELERVTERAPYRFRDENSAAQLLVLPNARLAEKREQLDPLEKILFDRRQAAMSTFWARSAEAVEPPGGSYGSSTGERLAQAQLALMQAQRVLREGPSPALRAIGTVFTERSREAYVVLNGRHDWYTTEHEALARLADRLEAGAIEVQRGVSHDLNAVSSTDKYRGLSGYASYLRDADTESPLLADLQSLQPGQLWLDVGAGTGNAIEEALKSFAVKCDVLGVDPLTNASRLEQAYPGQVGFQRKRLEEATLPKKASVITDIYANLAYNPDYAGALQSELDRLETGGRLYAMMIAPLNYVVGTDGRSRTLEDWTAEQPGLEVTQFAGGGMMIRKLQDEVKVGKLELAGFSNGKPPQRVYYEPGFTQATPLTPS
jgi:SAM-dependent methyltransferase